jgi:hypothetical protein
MLGTVKADGLLAFQQQAKDNLAASVTHAREELGQCN